MSDVYYSLKDETLQLLYVKIQSLMYHVIKENSSCTQDLLTVPLCRKETLKQSFLLASSRLLQPLRDTIISAGMFKNALFDLINDSTS